jgi:hypothetical protein
VWLDVRAETSVLFCKWVNSTELACPQAPLTSPGAVSIVIKIGPNIISPANLTFLFYGTSILFLSCVRARAVARVVCGWCACVRSRAALHARVL